MKSLINLLAPICVLALMTGKAQAAPIISLAAPVGLSTYNGNDPHNGRGVVFQADQNFSMSAFQMDANWSGLFDFTLDVYDWNSNSRGSLLSSSSVSDVADPGGPAFLTLNHNQSFGAGSKYEVIVRYTNPGVSFKYFNFNNSVTNIAGGYDVGGYLTVLDGTDFNNITGNNWLANFSMDVGPAESVPAPSALILLGLGLLGLSARHRAA